LPGTVRRQ
jgi:hypothetical protein